MKRSLAFALPLAVLMIVAGASAASPPPSATATCRDGTYSFSQHRSGTCSHHGGVAVWLTGVSASAVSPTSASMTAPPGVGHTVVLAPRTRSSGCQRGPEPDLRCSPGAYYSGLSKEVICAASFRTGPIRNVPQAEKYAVEREYGMAARFYGRTIEIDHIISLELGGSNDIPNLFPEPASGNANYHAKDALENRLHDMVCDGALALRAARLGIAHDWITLYRRVFGKAPGG